MLKQRVLTALILSPLFFSLILYGDPIVFASLIIILGILFLRELFDIFPDASRVNGSISIAPIMTYLIPPLGYLLHIRPFLSYSGWSCFYLACSTGYIIVHMYKDLKNPFFFLLVMIFSLNYIGIFTFSALCLYSMDSGLWLTLFLFIVVFTGDIFAYFSGMLFGKARFFPHISPKKTWEGAFGGLISSIIAGVIFAHYYIQAMSSAYAVFVSFILAIIAQSGDLLESMIKREFKKKDSGSLLPGHGGFLDRFDGVILALPCFYMITQILISR